MINARRGVAAVNAKLVILEAVDVQADCASLVVAPNGGHGRSSLDLDVGASSVRRRRSLHIAPTSGAGQSSEQPIYGDRSQGVINAASDLLTASRRLSAAFSGSFVTEAGRKQAYALAVEAAATARRIVEALS